MSTPVSSLCCGKFESLELYFGNLDLVDLSRLCSADVINVAKSQDKLLMTIFVREKLARFLGQTDAFDDGYDEGSSSTHNPIRNYSADYNMAFPPPWKDTATYEIRIVENGTLDLKNRIVPGSPFIHMPARFLTLVEPIRELVPDLKSVKILDLSSNGLKDSDVDQVVELMKILPSCKTLNLSGNHLHGNDDSGQLDRNIKTLLAMKNLDHVMIVITALASTSRQDFFDSLTPDEFRKLIWIGLQWLAEKSVGRPSGWRTMINSKAIQDLIVETHEKFYAGDGFKLLVRDQYMDAEHYMKNA